MVPKIEIFGLSQVPKFYKLNKNGLKKKFSRTLLCSNDNFNLKYNRKLFNRKKTSIPDSACFTYEQMFRPVKCTACKICQCSSKTELVLSRVTAVLSTPDQPHYLRGIICSGIRTEQYSTYLSQS